MTVAKVVDASALAAVLFAEPEAGEIIERLGNARPLAPAILAFELTNICWKKCRREPYRREELVAALRLRLAFDIEEKPVDQEAVLALALETGSQPTMPATSGSHRTLVPNLLRWIRRWRKPLSIDGRGAVGGVLK